MTFEDTFSAGFTETRVVSGGCAPLLPLLPPTEGHTAPKVPRRQQRLELEPRAGLGKGRPLPGRQGRVEGQCLGSSEGSSLCQSHHPNRPGPYVLETQHQMHTHRTERYLAFVSDYKINKLIVKNREKDNEEIKNHNPTSHRNHGLLQYVYTII